MMIFYILSDKAMNLFEGQILSALLCSDRQIVRLGSSNV